MASYAHLAAPVFCPYCGMRVETSHDLVAFQWGYCPSRLPWDELFYGLGDEIRWRVDDEGRVPAWSYFEGDTQGGNLGDPGVHDLLVRALDLGGSPLRCAPCGVDLAIAVTAGRIERIAPLAHACDLAVIEADGTITPRPDWDDHPMPDLLRVRSRRLVTRSGEARGRLAPS